MLRTAIAGFVLASVSALTSGAALAQWDWGQFWDDDPYPFRKPYNRQAPADGFFWGDEQRPRRPAERSPSRKSGGARPAIAPVAPDRIAFPSAYPVGSIVIDHKGRQLFLIKSPTEALRYPISVGREGFGWSGTQVISKVVDWPDWYPPADMRARDPRLPAHMTGGLKNPLGAKALYLGNTLYRIHGTNDPRSIGKASSSGCFRMLNGHVIDLARRAGVGTTVTVVRRLPPSLDRVVAAQLDGSVPMGLEAKAPAAKPADAAPDNLFDEEPIEDEPIEDGPAGEGAGAPTRGRPG